MIHRAGASSQRRRAGLASLLAAIALASMLVTGCANLAPLPAASGVDALSGRLAVRVEAAGAEAARAFSAAFDLRGDSRAGTLALSTPLGSMLAQARWAPGDVALVTPQGARRFPDLAALTRDVLGESVPVETWFDWLRGRPWPGAPSSPDGNRPTPATDAATTAAPVDFTQLGWAVDLSRLGAGRIVATRLQPAPPVIVRIQLDAS